MVRKLIVSLVPLFIFSGCAPKVEKTALDYKTTISSQIESNMPKYVDDKLQLKTDWWKIYNDRQLNEIIDKALTSAPSIKSVEARYKLASDAIKSAEATTMPSLSISAAVSRDRFSENDIYPPPYGGGYYSRYQTGIELNYDFDFWNTKSSVVQAAKETKFAQMAYLEASKLALASAIAKSYISWNFDEKRLQTLNSMKFIFAEEYSILDAKFQRGLIDEVEINVQKSRISKINQQIFATKRLVESKKESICILAGFEPSVISTFHTPNIDENIKAPFPSTVYLDILSHRPDISIQKHIALSKSAKIDYAKSRFYPNINLSGLIGLVSLDQAKFLDASSSAPSAQLAISLPIFDWGERKAYLQGSVNDYESSVYDYNGAVVKAANEVVGTLKKSRLIDSQITYQNDELNSKVSNEKISQKRLVLGLAGRLPYLFAKADKSISILDKMALKEEEMMLQVDLIQALGGGYEDKQGNKDARK